MFSSNDLQQQTNDDPAMLDNVAQLARDPADTVVPSSPPPIAQTTAQASSPFTPTTASPTPPAQQTQSVDDQHRAEPAEGFSSSTVEPASPAPQYIAATDTENDHSTSTTSDSSQTEQASPSTAPTTTPIIQSTSAPVQDSTSSDTQTANATSAPVSNNPAAIQQAPDQEHLAGLKQQALQHLEPLASHVDGTPEEMFKTTMMMIQANDNHTLLEKALEAAKNIEDDKIRAKAMLDVINEINYFSQNSSDE